jgi:hypothetical protein
MIKYKLKRMEGVFHISFIIKYIKTKYMIFIKKYILNKMNDQMYLKNYR